MATLLKTDGTKQTISPINGTDFNLEELQKYVNGLIEVINLNNGKILIINEEGKLENLEVNHQATKIAKQYTAIYKWDVIVGDVVLCKDKEVL